MKQATTILMTAIAGIAVSLSCDSPTESTQRYDSTLIHPLSIGQKWTYRREYINWGSAKRDTVDTITFEVLRLDTLSHVSDTVAGYLCEWYTDVSQRDDSLRRQDLYLNTDSGFVHLGTHSEPANALRYKYPVAAGDEWRSSDCYGSQPYQCYFIQCIALDSTITTPAGTFRAIVYRKSFADSNYYQYYCAPGVGMVKLISVEYGELVQDRRLIAFEL